MEGDAHLGDSHLVPEWKDLSRLRSTEYRGLGHWVLRRRGWRGDAHLGDAHLVPEPRAYKPERLLVGVLASALALMYQVQQRQGLLLGRRGLYERDIPEWPGIFTPGKKSVAR